MQHQQNFVNTLCIYCHIDSISWFLHDKFGYFHKHWFSIIDLVGGILRYPIDMTNNHKNMTILVKQDSNGFAQLIHNWSKSKILIRGWYKTVLVYKWYTNIMKALQYQKLCYTRYSVKIGYMSGIWQKKHTKLNTDFLLCIDEPRTDRYWGRWLAMMDGDI